MNKEFGDYLRMLIQSAGMTQVEFYNAWGIKKPYFYDILSGRTSAPPYPLQHKAVEILGVDKEEQEHFFDMAAKSRGEIPADIAEVVYNNPTAVKNIRMKIEELTTKN